jgi:hypothetical protein
MTQAARLPAYGPIGQAATLVTADVASLAANTTSDTALTVPGALVGDTVEITPLGTWPAGVVMGPHRVSAADTVQMRVGNVTAGAVDPASQQYKVVLNHIQP